MNRIILLLVLLITGLFLVACQSRMPAPTQPQSPNFVFQPPSSSAIKTDMAIGILSPSAKGSLFVQNYSNTAYETFRINRSDHAIASRSIQSFLTSAQTDLEKILIAKGFPTAGSYASFDDMTYSQKAQATLVLQPYFDVNLDVAKPQGFSRERIATISGFLSFELVEPMTREKIWIKRLQIPPLTKNVPRPKIDLFGEPKSVVVGNQLQMSLINPTEDTSLQDDSLIGILNDFYAITMTKIWEHFDPVELAQLKSQVMEVRQKSQYNRK